MPEIILEWQFESVIMLLGVKFTKFDSDWIESVRSRAYSVFDDQIYINLSTEGALDPHLDFQHAPSSLFISPNIQTTSV